jgi:hypothetical protein
MTLRDHFTGLGVRGNATGAGRTLTTKMSRSIGSPMLVGGASEALQQVS